MIVGRTAELAVLSDLCRLAAAGGGGSVLVEGEAGIGKSALLRALAREPSGLRVLWGHAPEEGGAPAYWVWREIASAGDWGVDWEARSDAWALAADVARAARHAAAGQPLLVLLDDLHAADDDTVRLTAYLAQVLAGEPIALVIGSRPAPRVAGVARHCQRVSLPPLEPAHAQLLVERSAARPLDQRELQAIHDAAEGNPLVLQELARTAGAGPLSREVQSSVQQRLVPLDDLALRLVAVASVLGRRFDVLALAAVAQVDLPRVLSVLDLVRRAGLADGAGHQWSFTHQVVRDVVYDGMALDDRLRTHARAAEVLVAGSRSAAAAHLIAAVPLVPAADAVAAARQAAEEARAVAGPGEHAALLGRAVAVVTDEGERLELLLELGAAQLAAGQTAGASDTFTRALALARTRGDWRAHATAALGRTERLLTESAMVTRHPELSLAVADARAHGDHAVLSQLLARCSQLRAAYDPESGRAEAEEAVRLARGLADPVLLATALLALHMCHWGPGQEVAAEAVSAELVQVAGRSGDLDLALEAELARMVDGLRTGQLAVMDAALDRAAVIAERSGSPRHLFFVLSRRASRAIVAGRLTEAGHLIRRAREVGEAIEEPDALQVYWGTQFLTLAQLSAVDEIRDMVVTVQGWVELDNDLAPVLANLHAGAGDLSEAERILRAYLAGRPPGEAWPKGSLAWGALLANTAVAVGRPDLAAVVEASLRPFAGQLVVNSGAVAFCGCVEHWLGALAQVQGRTGDATALLQQARQTYLAMGATYFVGLVDGLMATEPEGVGTRPRSAVLRREGAGWLVGWTGRTAVLPDARGLQHLHALLRADGQEVHVHDLVSTGSSALWLGQVRDPVLDDTAKRAYRDRVRALQEQVDAHEDAGDESSAAEAAAELDTLLAELRRAVGLGGRDRWQGDDTERARVAVRKAITSALSRIAEHDPSVAAHLRSAVRTGTRCAYEPDPLSQVAWALA